jgi:hypothetical protein
LGHDRAARLQKVTVSAFETLQRRPRVHAKGLLYYVMTHGDEVNTQALN